MSLRYSCGDGERAAGIRAAVAAVRSGELAVIPTDTVYGVCADAFNPSAVARLMTARGQGRQAPLTVLVGTVRAANALTENLSSLAQDFINEFWPGALTLVCRASRTLSWDLGDTRGTVAIRMPLHPVALDLLKETGPLAVSSASLSGSPAATTADEAEAQLGEAIAVLLDGGPCAGPVPSTIVDLTGPVPRLLREGAIPLGRLSSVAYVEPLPVEPPEERREFESATPGELTPESAAELPSGAHTGEEQGADDAGAAGASETSQDPAGNGAPGARDTSGARRAHGEA